MGTGGPTPSTNVLSGRDQMLNGPTQYLTLNTLLMSLKCDPYMGGVYQGLGGG